MSHSMTLSDLLAVLPDDIPTLENSQEVLIHDLVLDSRKASPGALFLAYPGGSVDGRNYIESAIELGASAIFYERIKEGDECLESLLEPLLGVTASVPAVAIDNLREKVGVLANHFFDRPSADIQVFGVTGTNGKTTCCYLLTQALTGLGMKAAMIGTIGVGELSSLMELWHTTPDPISVHRLLAQWRDQGITQVCMEVSSHALDQGRVSGIQFFCTLFTNLSHDHLDYHGDMAGYANAKRKLFTEYQSELVITNADDDVGAGLIDVANSEFIASYGDNGDVKLEGVELTVGGMTLHIEAGDADFSVKTPLIGKVNIPNVMMLVTTLLSLSTSIEDIQRIVAELEPAPGRMELYIAENSPNVVVDYAHTPDALERALISIEEHCQGQLWCVFGCGGDRDSAKRPLMGEIATRLADRVVLTNDNPRFEKPQEIVADIKLGIDDKFANDCSVELDRAQAIRTAIEQANTDDWVLVAGKGHELTQTIGADVRAFSDREQVSAILGVVV